jgi:hypothetical protein
VFVVLPIPQSAGLLCVWLPWPFLVLLRILTPISSSMFVVWSVIVLGMITANLTMGSLLPGTFNQKQAYEREQVTAVRIQSNVDSLQIRRTSFLIWFTNGSRFISIMRLSFSSAIVANVG